ELLVHVQPKPEGGGPKESFLPARDIASPRAVEHRNKPAIKSADLEQREAALQKQREEVELRQKELEDVRQELAGIRLELYERYRHRRDRLAGLHEAINRAARKVQDRKREIDA